MNKLENKIVSKNKNRVVFQSSWKWSEVELTKWCYRNMEIYSIRFSACKYSENSWFSAENTADHF